MQPKLHITDFWIFKSIVYVFEEHFACVDSLMCFRLFQYDGNVYIYVEGNKLRIISDEDVKASSIWF
jgi:hypothetical protein